MFAVTRKSLSHFSDSRQKNREAWGKSFSFAEFRFDGVGGCELPISMWLGAWGTGMQFTNFPDSRTTSGTRYG